VNLFVLSVEIEDRDEIGTGRSTKRCSTLNDIQGVSEIRVLILTSGRTRQIMELFSITFLRKSNTN
jgi:hypothetical protein